MIGSGAPLRLTTDSADDYTPAWSRDGRYIAFVRHSGGKDSLYIVPPLGGAERWVSDVFPPSDSWTMAWGPDSTSVFLPNRDSADDPWFIEKLSIGTRERQPLTSPPPASYGGDTQLAVSPDGKWLAFVRTTNHTIFGDVFVKPLAGGEEKQITFLNQTFAGIAWTPAGDGIVLSAGDLGATPSLWRVSLSGGEPRQVAEAGSYPAISSQANRLAYQQVQFDSNIWRSELPPEGGTAPPPRKLIGSTQLEASPQISPDGKRIVYYSLRSGSREIWVCDADGSNAVQVTTFGGPPAGSPRWSPDGRQIAFDASPRGNWDIFVISAQGGSPRALTTYEGEDSRPSWSRDGRWVYFNSLRSGRAEIWKVPLAGGEPLQVTTNGAYHAVESPDARYLYYGKTHESTLYRLPLAGGDEEAVMEGVWAEMGAWAFGNNGIYYLNAADRALRFLDLDSGQTRTLLTLSLSFGDANPLALSPDGKWVLYTQADLTSSDLMLVENFR